MKVKFRKRIFSVTYLDHDTGVFGETDEANKTIEINATAPPRRQLEAEIDEAIHACFPDLDNEAVDQASGSIGKFLWRVGYRRSEG